MRSIQFEEEDPGRVLADGQDVPFGALADEGPIWPVVAGLVCGDTKRLEMDLDRLGHARPLLHGEELMSEQFPAVLHLDERAKIRRD